MRFPKWPQANNSVHSTLKKLYFSIRQTIFTEEYFHVKMWEYKKKVCEKMIQPIGAFSPRADFRGHGVNTQKTTPQERSKAQVALINATGTSIVAGALTTAIARSYTTSWAHAGILGVCGSVLSMFFITPMLVENTTLLKGKKKQDVGAVVSDGRKTHKAIKEGLKPAKKMVQFRQS